MNPYVIGIVASILSSVSFIPQVIKVYRERSAQSISFLSFFTIATASCLWMTYGFLIKDWPLIVTNTIVCTLSVMMLAAKWFFAPKR